MSDLKIGTQQMEVGDLVTLLASLNDDTVAAILDAATDEIHHRGLKRIYAFLTNCVGLLDPDTDVSKCGIIPAFSSYPRSFYVVFPQTPETPGNWDWGKLMNRIADSMFVSHKLFQQVHVDLGAMFGEKINITIRFEIPEGVQVPGVEESGIGQAEGPSVTTVVETVEPLLKEIEPPVPSTEQDKSDDQ